MLNIKTIAAWFFLLIFSIKISAQQYDKVWVFGQPMATMTFNADSIVSGLIPNANLQSFGTMGNICDRTGNLLFYTNGVNVYNILGDIMMNGDTLSAPSEYYSLVEVGGMPGRQEAVILPKPGDSNLYYIFHYTPTDTVDVTNGGGYEPLNLYYSIVDMRLGNGQGAVTAKNVPIIQNELLSASRLAACRHANGRDWWIVKNVWHENIYYKFLLTPNGVQGPFIQQIGPLYGTTNELPAYAAFSPDGSKYASVTAESFLVLMDFDRCSGLFSNPDSLFNNDSSDPLNRPASGGVNIAFSPNGRFLYINNPIELNQYNLWSLHIHDSVRIETDTGFYQMNTMQLAPNGKIYISCWNGGSYKINVINQPDSLGSACDFQLLGQNVLSLNPTNLPYFPNFRLGPLPGNCDTLTEIENIMVAHPAFATVTPNPATDRAEIIYYTSGNTANQAMIYDINGKVVWSANVTGSSGVINVNVSPFPAGMYFVKFTTDSRELLNSKLVVIR
jgi:outer membrane protein assembly factor BamB